MQLQAKYVVLGLLSNRPMSGYEIKKHFEGNFSFFFDASYGSVYPTLNKLEQEGFISKTTIRQEDRPNKHEYELTPSGKQLFESYLRSPLLEDSIRSDLCMRLYFGEFADERTVVEWIETGIRRHEDTASTLRGIREQFKERMSMAQALSLQIGIDYHQNICTTLLQGLEQMKTHWDSKPKEE